MGYLKHINDFETFLLSEKLHVNDISVDISKIILNRIKTEDKFVLSSNLLSEANIKNLYIELIHMKDSYGYMDFDKCVKTDTGWNIYVYINKNTAIYSNILHEMTHVVQLTRIDDKNKFLRKYRYIELKKDFNSDETIDRFFNIVYLLSDFEIGATVSEIYGYIKEKMDILGMDSLTESQFKFILRESYGYQKLMFIKNYDIKTEFSMMSSEDINKFFVLFNDKSDELEFVYKDDFHRYNKFVSKIKNIFKRKKKVMKTKKGLLYYDKYFKNQIIIFERKIDNLLSHFI